MPFRRECKSEWIAVKYIIDALIASASSSRGTGLVLIHIIDLDCKSRPHPTRKMCVGNVDISCIFYQ